MTCGMILSQISRWATLKRQTHLTWRWQELPQPPFSSLVPKTLRDRKECRPKDGWPCREQTDPITKESLKGKFVWPKYCWDTLRLNAPKPTVLIIKRGKRTLESLLMWNMRRCRNSEESWQILSRNRMKWRLQIQMELIWALLWKTEKPTSTMELSMTKTSKWEPSLQNCRTALLS